MEGGYDFVAPVYVRHKYDGTITNNIVYNLTRALYEKADPPAHRGDFALSRNVAKFYADQDVWETDVARYGIDIWMTTNAITQGFRICQSNLGVKITTPRTRDSTSVPCSARWSGPSFSHGELRGVLEELQGERTGGDLRFPKPRGAGAGGGRSRCPGGPFQGGIPAVLLSVEGSFLPRMLRSDPGGFDPGSAGVPAAHGTWIQTLYDLAATFHSWKVNRYRLIDLVTPLYYARVASFVRQSLEMTSEEAENLVEEQAVLFEEQKDYLVHVWEEKTASRE